MTPEGWEAYHAGYFNHIVNKNPNYILPLSFLRDLEGKGQIGTRARVDVRAARRQHAGGDGARARAQHRGGSQGGARRRRPPRRHLRDLQSLRRNDREGDRASGNPGGHDLGHLQLRADDGRQPRGARRAHRARVRRSRPRAREGLRVRHAHRARRRSRPSRCRCRGRRSSTRTKAREIQGRRPMRLELGTLPGHGRSPSATPRAGRDGHLTVDKAAALAAVRRDPRIATANLEIAAPGDSVRIWPVRDVIEPRIKVEGAGQCYPGHLRPRHRHGGPGTHAPAGRHGRRRGLERQLARRGR